MIRPGPSFSVQDVAFGWRDGLRDLGVIVADVNFDDRLDFYSSAHVDKSAGNGEFVQAFDRNGAVRLAAKSILSDCYTFWPDVVLITSGFFVPAEVVAAMRSKGHKIVYLFTESPYEDDQQLERAALADLVILNDPTNLERFRAVNPNSHYVPHAYNPARHHPGPAIPEMKCDLAFVGTGFPSRVEFFEQADLDGLDVILAGSWSCLTDDHPLASLVAHRRDWCIDNAEAADLYRSCKASLNLYRQETTEGGTADGWAIGPREVELAACGTFFLRNPRPEGDELFPMLPTITEPDELRPLLDWWLTHDEARENAALQAREAIAPRTFRANADWLARQLGE